jgi:L,D-peptidoglycan transpeptidase YkuD (ErfK/YbiS/YcfS/YnhG family)
MSANCPYCGEPWVPSALICKTCKNNETPAWFARLQAHWSLGLVRAFSVGTIVAVALTLYSTYSTKQVRLRDRSQSLAEGMLLLQKTADDLRQPCTLVAANDCRKRFAELTAAFGASNYKFKEEARYLIDADSPIQNAINFVDDFYNPGEQPSEHPLAALQGAPLQEAILGARAALSEPYTDAKWCTPGHREAMRALTVSIDTYRYCANVIRRFIWTTGSQRDESKLRDSETFKECVIDEPTVQKANRIQSKLFNLDNYDHSAPWLFDSYCAAAGVSIGGGPVIPAATKQLVVVAAQTWNSSDGKLTRYVRGDAKSRWEKVGDETAVMLGKNGLAWGRGLWQSATKRGATPLAKEGPVKAEGDGRAPAGLFKIGSLFSEDPLPNAKAKVEQIDDSMYCEDQVASEQYNLLAKLNAEQAKQCRDDKSKCPAELLHRTDGVYKRLFWIHHNDAPVAKGAGSCIFLHLDHVKREPTAGCTTVASAAMDQLIEWLDPAAQPLLLQLPREQISSAIDLP